jgi:hypothetical protein
VDSLLAISQLIARKTSTAMPAARVCVAISTKISHHSFSNARQKD